MIKEFIESKRIKSLASNIFEELEAIEEYGHVGTHAITKEEVKKHNELIIKHLEEVEAIFNKIQTGIKESYEY